MSKPSAVAPREPSAGTRVDHGARGMANRARPQHLQETPQAGVFRKAMEDAHLIDRLRNVSQLSDRQHAAAVIVATMHDEAGFEPKVVAAYAPRGWSGGHDEDTEEQTATTRFRHLLGDCSEASAWLLHQMCLGQHPTLHRLGSLQAALDDLAKKWGISDDDGKGPAR